MAKLTLTEVQKALGGVPHWKLAGDGITRVFQFKDFPAAIKFVNRLAELAEKASHHPDIDIRWNKVSLLLSTHDAGGLTVKDFDLARKIDMVAQ
jgi:4a-hydroxytetrahydrobiopterin dehydratase